MHYRQLERTIKMDKNANMSWKFYNAYFLYFPMNIWCSLDVASVNLGTRNM